MEKFKVAFIGHRWFYYLPKFKLELETFIAKILGEHQFVEFFVGNNGEFDTLVVSIIKKFQKNKNFRISLVLPFHLKDEDCLVGYYDRVYVAVDVCISCESAISIRNKWLVDNCDLLVAYVYRDNGEAVSALNYAKKTKRKVINFAK